MGLLKLFMRDTMPNNERIKEIVEWVEDESLGNFTKGGQLREKLNTLVVPSKTRSSSQNASLWLWFTHLAQELNLSGNDMKGTIQVDMWWDKDSIHKHLWLPVQKMMFDTDSTTKLEGHQIDKIYDTINKTIGERTNVYVPFPSDEHFRN